MSTAAAAGGTSANRPLPARIGAQPQAQQAQKWTFGTAEMSAALTSPVEAPASAASLAPTEVAPETMAQDEDDDEDEQKHSGQERSVAQSPGAAASSSVAAGAAAGAAAGRGQVYMEQLFQQALVAYQHDFGRAKNPQSRRDVESIVSGLVLRNNGQPHTYQQLRQAHDQLVEIWKNQPEQAEQVTQPQQVGFGQMSGASSFGASAAVGGAGAQNFGPSPHPSQMVRYDEAKRYISSKFEASILQPREKELSRLRAEVDALNGVIPPSDPRYKQIVDTATVQFLRDGNGKKMIDKRHKQLQKKQGQFQALISQMDGLRRELAEVRLIGQILEHKVREDEQAYKQINNDAVAWAEKKRRELEQKYADQKQRADEKLAKKAKELSRSYNPSAAAGKSSFNAGIKQRFIDDEAEEAIEDEEEPQDEDMFN